jgi:uncharacterized protein (DUF58 family)
VTRRGASRLGAYAALAALGLLAAVVLGLPELAVLVSPFALLVAAGLVSARPPRVELDGDAGRERALEGETLGYRLTVRTERAVERLEVFLALAPGLEAEPGTNPVVLRLGDGEERELELPVRCARWGGYAPGLVHLRASDRLGVVAWEDVRDLRRPLRVYPRPEALRSLLRPRETQPYVGNQVARTKGDGIEFADIRPFVPGDRVRRVNWRASARRGDLVVNEAHPERNTDVVLFLDTFTDVRGEERGTLDLTVRAAAALTRAYLEQRDRVGVVGFGGILSWLLPGSGLAQLYRIVDALLETEIVLNYAWKDVDLLPPRTLPPQALVVGLTPLLDERSVGALLDLRARGFDLAIVEVSPAPFAPAGSDAADRLAHRLWLHTRAALRHRFEAAGVPVAEWRDGQPLAAPVEEVEAWRRQGRVARA